MTQHERFHFKTSDQLLEKAAELGIDIPFQSAIDPLLTPVQIGSKTVSNRIAVQPMEGYDSLPDGTPGELTARRYKRYAEGGNGLIWFEATSIMEDGRSNSHQLLLHNKTKESFRELVSSTRKAARVAHGNSHIPFLVLQLTHSGRFSYSGDRKQRQVVCRNPHLDQSPQDLVDTFCDVDLARFRDIFIEAAGLAEQAGFDAVDIKACHGYLMSELLGAFNRKDSIYGGSYENRTRLLKEVIRGIRESCEIGIAVRLSGTDGIPYPYGFGVRRDGSGTMDLSEPIRLARELEKEGCRLLNFSAGIPYHLPHVCRPCDRPEKGAIVPNEHPLVSVHRLISITDRLQHTVPGTAVVGTGYSWLRHFWPCIGAAVIAQEKASLIGLGRGNLAYPDAAYDLMKHGKLNPRKCCVTSSLCTDLMRMGRPTGCAIRDRDIYTSEYRKMKRNGQ